MYRARRCRSAPRHQMFSGSCASRMSATGMSATGLAVTTVVVLLSHAVNAQQQCSYSGQCATGECCAVWTGAAIKTCEPDMFSDEGDQICDCRDTQRPRLPHHQAVLLQNHGPVRLGAPPLRLQLQRRLPHGLLLQDGRTVGRQPGGLLQRHCLSDRRGQVVQLQRPERSRMWQLLLLRPALHQGSHPVPLQQRWPLRAGPVLHEGRSRHQRLLQARQLLDPCGQRYALLLLRRPQPVAQACVALAPRSAPQLPRRTAPATAPETARQTPAAPSLQKLTQGAPKGCAGSTPLPPTAPSATAGA